MNRLDTLHHSAAGALLALLVGGLSSCSPAADDAPQPADIGEIAFDLIDSGGIELIDLSHSLSPDSLYWPTGAPFEHEVTSGVTAGGYWYSSGSFSSPEHLGTHLDAPIHFGEGRWNAAEIPLRRLFARGAVIDISAKATADADATLSPDDIAAWEQRNGALAAGSIVIVRSGWARHWPDWNAYYGSATPADVSTLHFPGVSPAAAAVLVERGVAGVGLDTASIDPGPSADFQAHRILAAGNIFNLENLTNVDTLPETGFGIIALPMKIDAGTGGPTRVIATVPR